jgi:hypothetical protein
MCDDLAHQEEVVDDMKFLPDRHFLHTRTHTIINIGVSDIVKLFALIL